MLQKLKKILKNKPKYVNVKFENLNFDKTINDLNFQRIKNLLRYTKKNLVSYNGRDHEFGYHSFNINNQYIRGQREIGERFKELEPFLKGKNILDVGSNQGGVLYYLSDVINYGIGIDYDFKMVNVSNKIRNSTRKYNIEFYVFDIEKEKFEVIDNLISTNKVDVVLLLSVCMWISNWKELIDYCFKLSNEMIFETNGSFEEQKDQVDYLTSKYNSIKVHSEYSNDDLTQKNRKLLVCSK